MSAAGALTPKQPATVAAGSRPAGIAVSPDGASAYVTNQLPSGTITQFSIDASSGDLAPKAQPVGAGSQPRGIVAAAGRVYVTNIASNTISQYAADGAGALSELAPAVAAPRNPFGLALAPDGKSLYVAGFGDADGRPVRRGRRRVARRQGRPCAGQLPPPGRGGGQAARRAGADHRPGHAGRGRRSTSRAPTSRSTTRAPTRAARASRRARATCPTATRWTPRRRAPTTSRWSRATATGNETTRDAQLHRDRAPAAAARPTRASTSRASSDRSTRAAWSTPATRSRSSSRSAATRGSTSWPPARPPACRPTAATPARRPAAIRPRASRAAA